MKDQDPLLKFRSAARREVITRRLQYAMDLEALEKSMEALKKEHDLHLEIEVECLKRLVLSMIDHPHHGHGKACRWWKRIFHRDG